VLLLLGSVWVSQGNITAGLMTLKKAAQVDPRNVKVHLQMGEILRDCSVSMAGFDCATQFSRSTGIGDILLISGTLYLQLLPIIG